MYKAPVDDMKFALAHLVGIDEIAALPDMDMLSDDLVDAVLQEASKVAGDIIAPLNHDGDVRGATRNDDGSVSLPEGFAEAWQTMADGGWVGLEAHPEHGGQGLPLCLSSVISEMWNSANMSFALCHLLTQSAINVLEGVASSEQKGRFLPKLASGEWTGTMNLTEPQAGTDLGALRTMATKKGDHYLIKGQKIYVTYGQHDMSKNIIHLVLARTPDAPVGVKGLSLFIVPKILIKDDGSLGTPNDVFCVSIEKKLGIKASPTAVLQYGDNGGAVGYLIGEENRGLEYMFLMMNNARLAVGMQGVAISERAYQQAVQYAHDRVQGTPLSGTKGDSIIHHPDILRILTIMKAEIEAMRALMVVGGACLDKAHGHAGDAGAFWHERASLLIPVIKGWMTERSLALTSDAVQIHGGMGFIEETGVAQHYRDARILPIYEGTTAIQANDLVFRKTLRDGGAAVKRLLADIDTDMNNIIGTQNSNTASLAQQVKQAVITTQSALDALLARTNAPRNAAAAGVDFVMLLGYLAGGWQMARAAAQAEADNLGNRDFMKAKQVSASAYMAYSLPEIGKLASKMIAGPEVLAKMDTAWF